MCISRSQENLIKKFCGSLWTKSDQCSQKATDNSGERVLCASISEFDFFQLCVAQSFIPVQQQGQGSLWWARHHVASPRKRQVERINFSERKVGQTHTFLSYKIKDWELEHCALMELKPAR